MSSYNLIPFTEMSAVAFTTIVTTTTATVDGDVIILDGAKALAFRALTTGGGATPPYSFASNRNSGLEFHNFTTGISFVFNGTVVVNIRLAGGANTRFAFGATQTTAFQIQPNVFAALSSGGFAGISGSNFLSQVGAGESGLHVLNQGTGTPGQAAFSFINSAYELAVKVGTATASIPTVLGSLWPSDTGHHFSKVGLLQQATTTMTPSTARSQAHVTNFQTGAASLFVTLPSTIAGLEYTITNAQGTAQTVVISPRAAGDRLSVFGLTKANGASVAANAPFSTITFHCITSTRWVATKLVGAWV